MDNDPKNSWDDLLEELGADPAADAAEPARAEPVTPEPPSTLDLDNLPEPTAAPSGWDSLLDNFGIDAPSPATAEEVKETASPEPVSQAGPPPTDDPAPEPPADGLVSEPGISPAMQDQPAPAGGETTAGSDVESKDDRPPAVEPAPAAAPEQGPLPDLKSSLSLPDWFPFAGRRNKAAAKASEAAAQAPAPTPPQPAAREEQPSEAEPAVQRAEPASTPSSDGWGLDASENEPASEPDLAEAATTAEGESSAADGDDNSAGDEKPTRRRRRRRGGRRRRRSSSENAEAPTEAITDGQAPLAEEDEEGLALQEVDETQSEPSADEPDTDEPPERGGRRGRSRRSRGDDETKAIPSWPEAIGVVVDGNIAMRSERKSAAVGGSGRGGRGGRSRGRRRRRPAE